MGHRGARCKSNQGKLALSHDKEGDRPTMKNRALVPLAFACLMLCFALRASADADSPDPAALLREVAKARLALPPVRMAIEAHYESKDVKTDYRLSVVADGDKRRFIAEAPKRPTTRGIFDGSVAMFFDGVNSATIFDPRQSSQADYLFDPRTLGISTFLSAGETVDSCLGLKNSRSVALIGREEVRGKSTWRVRVVDQHSQQLDFWIEPRAGFPVHRSRFATETQLNQSQAEVYCDDDAQFPWLPSRIEITYSRKGEPTGERRLVAVSHTEFGEQVPPETWTLAGLALPLQTPVADLRSHKRLGYWDGKGLSEQPSTTVSIAHKRSMESPPTTPIKFYAVAGLLSLAVVAAIFRVLQRIFGHR